MHVAGTCCVSGPSLVSFISSVCAGVSVARGLDIDR